MTISITITTTVIIAIMITIIPSTPTDDNYYYTYKDNYSDNFISVHTYKWLRYVYYKHALPLTMFDSDWLSMFFYQTSAWKIVQISFLSAFIIIAVVWTSLFQN